MLREELKNSGSSPPLDHFETKQNVYKFFMKLRQDNIVDFP